MKLSGVIKVPMSSGDFALIDEVDKAAVLRYRWHLQRNPWTRYAMANLYFGKRDGKSITGHITMHRLIMNAAKGMIVDHINHDGLDNRRANLRLATPSQNNMNQRMRRGGTSKFKGVCWNLAEGKWEAETKANGRRIKIGKFSDEIEAARAYDAVARINFGEFANLNFPEVA